MVVDIPYSIVGQTYQERSPEFDRQETVNFYIAYDPDGNKPYALIPTPGYASLITLQSAASNVRQLYSYTAGTTQVAFAVCGADLFLVNPDFTASRIATLTTSGGFVSFCNNNDQVMIVDGAKGYCYTIATGVLSVITDSSFPPLPLYCNYYDGYFVVCGTNTNQWSVSSLNDCTLWTYGTPAAPQFAEITYKANVLEGIGVVNKRLILFGTITTEFWYSSPNEGPFPYAADENMVFEFGLQATGSLAEAQGKLFWLSNTINGVSSVMMTDGGVPIAISTQAVDFKIRNYAVTDDAIGFIYLMDGHMFYQLTFPTEGVTWLCDFTPNNGNIWWTNIRMLDDTQSIALSHTYFANKHLIGSRLGPKIYDLSSDYVTDDGDSIHRRRVGTTMLFPNYNKFIGLEFEVDFEAGVGLANPPGNIPGNGGVNPVAFLSVSFDEGHTFNNPMREPIGKMGQYNWRSIWYGLGQFNMGSFTPCLDIYEPVRVYITGSNLKIKTSRT